MNLGKILDESSQDYHNAEAVSHSRLETFRRRPALYHRRYIAKTVQQETSAAFAIGSAFHMSVLEPTEYGLKYAFKPDGIDRRTTAGKAAYAAFEADAAGKTVIDMDDARLVSRMTEAVQANQIAARLLAEGEPEVSWRVKHDGLPLPIQCRTDWINTTEGYIVDLKSIDSLDGDNFTRNVVNFGYHRQVGFYTSLLAKLGLPDLQWYFVVVEKKEPFGVGVYSVTQSMATCGYNETKDDLNRLINCYATDFWPNIPTEIQKLQMPVWYKGGAL